jgi:hypothetical protein
MRRILAALTFIFALVLPVFAQENTATAQKRSLFGRMLHPFSSSRVMPQYKDPKLRGLALDVKIAPQPVKLSEVRQLEIKAVLTNMGKRPITLDFVTDQRIEIYLRNAAEMILTKWSDNHALEEKIGTLVINPEEDLEYKETIATRELAPNKVYVAEVYFPRYPELRVRQKFMTAP